MQAHFGIAHLALDFATGCQSGHRVYDDDIDRPRTDQVVCDFQRLFPIVGLSHQQIIGIDPQFLGISRVEGVFGIDESRNPARARYPRR